MTLLATEAIQSATPYRDAFDAQLSPLQRAVLTEARSWLDTPYSLGHAVKGQAVDCGKLVLRVLQAVGCMPGDADPGPYPRKFSHDQQLAQLSARYMALLRTVADPVPASHLPEPADLALFGVQGVADHLAIVVRWPLLIRTSAVAGRVVLGSATDRELAARYRGALRMHGC